MRKLRHQKKEKGSIEQWLLVIVMLLLLFWKKIEPMVKDFMCACSCDPEKPGTINLPDNDNKMSENSFEINKEEYERMNDQNVLNVEASTLTKQFNPDRDVLKIIRNDFSS